MSSITPTNEELGHHPRNPADNQLPRIQEVSNGYHLRNPGKPLKALGEALKDNVGLDIIIAIIADPRCGLERSSDDRDGYFTFSSSQEASYSTLPRAHGVDGYTSLFLAVIYSRDDVVRALLAKEADANGVATDGNTPLHVAAMYGRTACAVLLIDEGADVNVATDGYTPLHAAASYNRTACAKLLIFKGADVSAVNLDGYSPLHIASWKGFTACAELLLANGADVDVVAMDGYTPLHHAAASGHTNCVELLTAKGADVNARDTDGHTSFHIAAMNVHAASSELLSAEGCEYR